MVASMEITDLFTSQELAYMGERLYSSGKEGLNPELEKSISEKMPKAAQIVKESWGKPTNSVPQFKIINGK